MVVAVLIWLAASTLGFQAKDRGPGSALLVPVATEPGGQAAL
jgi:hypothetical protein